MFDLLQALMQRRDRVVPKQESLDVVWPGLIVEENSLQVHVTNLPRLLGSDAIMTVSGRGYEFTLHEDARSPSSPARLGLFCVKGYGYGLPVPLMLIKRGDATVGNNISCTQRV